ncbi:MAG: hypothetical protein WCI29_12360 [Actinomycetes bacterium]
MSRGSPFEESPDWLSGDSPYAGLVITRVGHRAVVVVVSVLLLGTLLVAVFAGLRWF